MDNNKPSAPQHQPYAPPPPPPPTQHNNVQQQPPPYGFQAPPPSYAQCVGGVAPSSPYVPPYACAEVRQTIVTTVVPVGTQPTHTICPHCHVEIDTKTRKQPGIIALISGFVILLLGCWAGCCLIPCCIDECMDIDHFCPNCQAHLGRFRR